MNSNFFPRTQQQTSQGDPQIIRTAGIFLGDVTENSEFALHNPGWLPEASSLVKSLDRCRRFSNHSRAALKGNATPVYSESRAPQRRISPIAGEELQVERIPRHGFILARNYSTQYDVNELRCNGQRNLLR